MKRTVINLLILLSLVAFSSVVLANDNESEEIRQCSEGFSNISEDICLPTPLTTFINVTKAFYINVSNKYLNGNMLIFPAIIIILLTIIGLIIKKRGETIVIQT